MTYEIRTADLWPDADYELRAAPEGFTFEGYAAVFDLPSVPLRFADVGGGRQFREVIQQGAFTDSLAANPDVTLRYQHNMMTLPLARTSSGTMSLSQDARGLRVQANLPDNEWGRPMRDAVARGDIRGMSFRFGNAQDAWTQDGKLRLRTLKRVDLGPEVSITDYPAYPDTVAGVRAVIEALRSLPEEAIEDLNAAIGEDKFSPEQREAIIALVNAHSDVPVLDRAHVDKKAQMLAKLEAIGSPA